MNVRNNLVYIGYFGDDHKLTTSLSLENEDTQSSSYASQVSGNASPATSDPTAGGTIASMKSGSSQSRSVGINFNAHYAFRDRYMINGGYRREGDSSMGIDNRWQSFPIAGLAWVASEEEFLKSQKWISFIKLRASWGQSGKTPSGSYPYIGTFKAVGTNYIDMSVIEPTQVQLDNLKWEIITQRNLGLDASFFNDKLTFTGDIYKDKTEDLLQKDYKVPSSSGYSKVKYINSGTLLNEGWEFRVDWEAYRNRDWTFSMNFNIAQNKNKFSKLPENLEGYMYEAKNGNYAYNVREGDPIGSFYGYRYNGVYQNEEDTYARDGNGNVIYDLNGKPVYMTNFGERVFPGDAKYEDINGDGVINEYDIVYLGNSNPKFTGGGGFDVKYKDWMLTTFFHLRLGQKVINQTRLNNENMYNTDNQSTAVLKRWRKEGDDTDIPRALYNKGYNYLGSDRFVEDASFLRLKTVTLRYNVPKEVLRKWNFTRLIVYCTAYDLFTWTDYKGQDPEVKLGKDGNYSSSYYMISKDASYTPKSRTFLFGLQLTY